MYHQFIRLWKVGVATVSHYIAQVGLCLRPSCSPPHNLPRAGISGVHQHLTETSNVPTSLIEEEIESEDS